MMMRGKAMADPRAHIHTLMRGIVLTAYNGVQQDAAKAMGDFWHPLGNCGNDFNTADLSRKMSGTRRWAYDDIMALQALAGTRRVSDAMGRVAATEVTPPAQPVQDHAQRLIKESSEAVSALIAMINGGSADVTLSELIDIQEAVAAAIRDLGGEA
jgi:hypothetical protein